MSLSRDQLLAAQPRQTEAVDTPELGGEVRVRMLSARELIDVEQSLTSLPGTAEKMAAQLAAFICSESGDALLSQEDALALVNRPGALGAIRKIINAGMALNGYGDLKGN